MTEKLYTVSELARLSGTTVRTIQYYDRINLLVAKRNGEKNARYYTNSDLMKLQQILFFKRIGLPLNEIKHHILNSENASDIKQILKNQAELLLRQEMEIRMTQTIIKAILASIDADPKQNLEPIIKLVLGLNKQSVLDYANVEFDQQTQQLFENQSEDDYQELIRIYWQWKQLVLEAAAYKLNDVSYQSQAGYQLGLKWDEFVNHTTEDDPKMLTAYTKGLEQSDQWPEEDIFLYNFAKDYIDGAHHYYLTKKGDAID
ncbi:MerR family transcriptional regulator [Paenibacillus senegalensis]|uniref:MerR family transcriptional regulator n=1 Tax=Paenibacillus senegalensis TaxID=1465766 RepID=UPI0002895D0C|nr:MerR family transcriptional regulator [Paenibacillus senegalensis]